MSHKQVRTRRGRTLNQGKSNPGMDLLEPRQLLSAGLLGIDPQAPLIGYFDGQMSYAAGSHALHLEGMPSTITQTPGGLDNWILSNIDDLKIDVLVDNAGNLIGGVAGDDLSISGGADLDGDYVPDVTGVLLTGEVLEFGSLDTGTNVDRYDFRFVVTGGLLANLWAGQDIGVTTTSENSDFTGSFETNFTGLAKGNVGAVGVSNPPAAISGVNYIDANNNGIMDAGEVPLAGTTVTLTGTNDQGPIAPITTTTDASGVYLFSGLLPGTYTVAETQPAGYLDGLDAMNNVVIAGSNTTDAIGGIVVNAGDMAANNNFGELLAASVAGSVYVDANKNGLMDAGEAPISGATVTLTGTNDLGVSVNSTTTTAPDGSYSFGALRPGTYSVAETQPAGYLDGLDAMNNVVIAGSNTTDAIGGLTVASGEAAVQNNFGELAPARLSGYNYVDANNDGIKQAGEAPIAGTTITLTGTNDLGSIAPVTTTTAADGSYSFGDLRPGMYIVSETQNPNYLDGLDTAGSLGGTVASPSTLDRIQAIPVGSGNVGVNYNFGELTLSGPPVGAGMTATIGFWHNKNGQALLTSLNGGASAKNLGNWLAATFPRLYGAQAGSNNLTGKTNTQVAAHYMTLFNVKGQKLGAQVLATAFAAYATNSALAGGTMAAKYGFAVSSAGTGAALYNVGTNGAAFGVANGTTLSIMSILLAANSQAVNGVLYGGVVSLQNAANAVFDGINTSGDII